MDTSIHRENPQKLYIQLWEILKKKIENSEWDVSSQIPTEEELCKIYSVSKATVRSAILELVREGYLCRLQGKGTFVHKKVVSDELTMLTSFRELMLEPGTIFSTRLLVRTMMMPVDDLITNLNISGDKHVIYIKRLTIVDNKPAILQEVYIPYHICPPLLEEDIENNSLFELFEKKYEIKITRVKNYFDIAYLNAEEGRLFDLQAGLPVLLLTQHFFFNETQIMYTHSIIRPNSLKFSIEFKKRLMDERGFYVKR